VIVAAVVVFQVATYTLPPIDLPQYVSEEPAIVWYAISGSTLADLSGQMNALGPHDDSGAHAGRTRSWTSWHVQFNGGDAANPCSMRTVRVTVYDTVTLPLWTPPPHPDSGVVAEWGRFVTMLGRHEAGHRSITIEAAGEIARALAILPSRASCSDMLAAANAGGDAILASSRARQKQYDADTQHGLRRGTALEAPDPRPPPVLLRIAVVAIVISLFGIALLLRARAR
jgi:predicted secreted Zn-dependent protease